MSSPSKREHIPVASVHMLSLLPVDLYVSHSGTGLGASVIAKAINKHIRYEPNDRPPHFTSIGASIQATMFGLSMITMVPIAIVHGAGEEEAYLDWMVFTAIVISGVGMILQATRFGRIGGGQLSLLTTSAAFISVSVETLIETNPATLATLVVLASPVNFLVSAYLPLLRRIITPVVAGTVLMLIGASFMPAAFALLHKVPEGKSGAGMIIAGVTVITVVALTLRGRGFLRLWTLVIALLAGSAISGFLGLYDFERISSAGWIGLPTVGAWPGLALEPGTQFWALLSVFLLITFANAIKTIGSAIVIEQVSWRNERPTGYRVVQGALNSDGITSMMCGFAGTPPATLIPDTASFITVTGIAARRVGILTGLLFIVVAFVPKSIAPLLAIPNPVIGGLLFTLGALVFIQGFKIVFQDGLDPSKAIIVGVSLWLGIAFQGNMIFTDHFSGALHILFSSGVIVGGMSALLLTTFMWLTSPRQKKLNVRLDLSSTSEIDDFLTQFVWKLRWSDASSARLRAAGEEALAALVDLYDEVETDATRNLLIIARSDEDMVNVEFIAGPSSENLEARLNNLAERPDAEEEGNISLRLLRHYASSVRHHSYYGVDIVTMSVEPI